MSDLPTRQILLSQGKNNNTEPPSLKLTALFDSGADQSYIQKNAVPPEFIRENVQLKIKNAFQTEIAEINESITCNVTIDDHKFFDIKFFLLRKECEYSAICGMNLLGQLCLDFRQDEPKILNFLTCELNNKETGFMNVNECGGLQLQNDLCIMPYQHGIGRVKTNNKGRIFPSNSLSNANCEINQKSIKKNKVRIHNRNAFPVIIEKNCVVAEFSEPRAQLNSLISRNSLDKSELETHLRELNEWERNRKKLISEINIEEDLSKVVQKVPESYREDTKKLLSEYNWIFSRSAADTGFVRDWLATIELEGDRPTFNKPYKIKHDLLSKVEKTFQDMNKKGIIESAISPFNSPCMFLEKKDKSIRMVTNFSSGGSNSVNKRIRLPRWPTTPVRTMLAKISAALAALREKFTDEEPIFAVLDIANAYHSLSLTESSRDFTAFIYADAQWRYRRLSQGLASAPGIFAALASKIVEKIGKSQDFYVFNYMDDVIVISRESHHLHAIRKVFDEINKIGLIIKASKCEFFKKSIKFLGYVITQTAIEADKSKTEALCKLEFPKTFREAQSFVGCFVYFCRLIPNVMSLLSPITSAISLGERFQLTENMKESIEKLREAIRSGIGAQHLIIPSEYSDPRLRIFCVSDSSLTQIGGAVGNCLLIGDTVTKIRIAGYASRALDKQEELLSSRARELIAIAYVASCFSDILPVDAEILFLCDHASLERVIHSSQLKTSGATRTKKALAQILEFPRCRIMYVPNTMPIIKLADNLSRHPITEVNSDIFNPSRFEKAKKGASLNSIILRQKRPEVDIDVIINAQKTCDIFSNYYQQLINSNCVVDGFSVKGKILYKLTEANRNLVVIPEKIAYDVLNYLHVSLEHSGAQALINQVKNEPIWIKMVHKKATQIINSCLFCSLAYNRKRTEERKGTISPCLEPFKNVYIDVVDITVDGKTNLFLTFLDSFSRKLSYRFIPTKEFRHVGAALTELTCSHGMIGSGNLCSDNGGEFVSAKLEECLTQLGVSHTKISPTNSNSNLVERSHKAIREILKTKVLTPANIQHKFALAVATYNNRPQTALNGRSPLEALCNIKVPRMYSKLEIEDQIKTQANIDIHVSEIQQMHLDLAADKIEKFWLKSNIDKNDTLHCGDFVVLRDKSSIGFHSTAARGPYKIHECRKNNVYALTHVLTDAKLIRNGRFLIKIKFSPEDKFMISNRSGLSLNEKSGELSHKSQIIDKPAEKFFEFDSLKKRVVRRSKRLMKD